jgi:hypothetical protein
MPRRHHGKNSSKIPCISVFPWHLIEEKKNFTGMEKTGLVSGLQFFLKHFPEFFQLGSDDD